MVHPRVTAAVKLLKTIKLNWNILYEISCVAPSIISSQLNLLFRLLSQGLMTVMWQGPFHSWCDRTTNLFTLKNAEGSLPRRVGGSWLSKWWGSNWLLLEQIPLEDFLLQQFQLSTAQKTFHQFVEGKKCRQCAISFQYALKVTDSNERLATFQPAAREDADQK